MELALVRCNDTRQWDAFVAESPQGNIFCSSAFLAACGERCVTYFVEGNGAALLGAMLFLNTDGQPLPSPRPFAMYQGVLFGKLLQSFHPHTQVTKQLKLVDFLLVELEKQYRRIPFTLHYTFPDVRSFSWFHYHERNRGTFKITIGYTGLIDIRKVRTMEDLLESIRTTRRQEVRKAQKKGWIVETSKDTDLLDRLHERTFDRQGMKRPEGEEILMRSIAKAALDHGFGEMLITKNTMDKVAGAILLLYDERSAYYLIGANDPEFRKDTCGSLLLVEGIMQSRKRGCSVFDVVGINSPARGEYKTSFNAVPTPYIVVSWEAPTNENA